MRRAASAASSPPIFVGLLKDAEGTYTYGFVGLFVVTLLCLAAAVWLMRPDRASLHATQKNS